MKILGKIMGSEIYQKTHIIFTHLNSMSERGITKAKALWNNNLHHYLEGLIDPNFKPKFFFFDYDKQDGNL